MAVAKLLGRLVCPLCGRGFNSAHIVEGEYDMPALPPPLPGQCSNQKADCPAERGQLSRRSDDTAETIRRRMQVYRESTAPLIDYYSGQGLLTNFRVLKGIKDAPRLVEKMTRP